MPTLLETIKQSKILAIKKLLTVRGSSYLIKFPNSEKVNISYLPLKYLKDNFYIFKTNENPGISETFLYLNKKDIQSLSVSLFSDFRLGSSIYFYIQLGEINFYNFYLPLKRFYDFKNKSKNLFIIPDFKLVMTFLKIFKLKLNQIEINEEIKTTFEQLKCKEEFFEIIKKYANEQYEEMRLLWEIL